MINTLTSTWFSILLAVAVVFLAMQGGQRESLVDWGIEFILKVVFVTLVYKLLSAFLIKHLWDT
ncbi:hypothetical protein [Salimicrobium flavidum]|uniref:Uncharacterized protein n=1 Tax=Salimicrobium flavidum TaxID=570947 RepID=A0A1N7JFI8_9BACI|nr:hypothetical protein [Salimicrobium flavidum]SIS48115.1 hypothetical protein SAMN05421687_105219 [Salimicrobium flavidum]